MHNEALRIVNRQKRDKIKRIITCTKVKLRKEQIYVAYHFALKPVQHNITPVLPVHNVVAGNFGLKTTKRPRWFEECLPNLYHVAFRKLR